MKTISLFGSSDDIISIAGDIKEEFYTNGEGDIVAVSDGTVLRIDYANSGLWKITVLKTGTCSLDLFVATDPDSCEYSDIATLKGDIEWVVCGKMAKVK